MTTAPSQVSAAAAHAAIAITSISVASERAAAGGYVYRTVLQLRESAGVAARIDAVDLTFMKGADVVMSARHDQPIPATGNMVPASGTAATRELIASDANPAHAYATSVAAKITFTDTTAGQAATAGSADVPPPSDPQPITYTLTGVITDQATAGAIAGTRVEALNGVNAGKATTTDQSGAYTLSGLAAGTFRMRASANGFDSGEQNVTLPGVTRADMSLRRPAAAPAGPCSYTVTPTAILGVPFMGAQSSLTIAQTSGTCGWQAKTDVSWMTLTNPAGNGNATLMYSAGPNPGFNSRVGVITVQWSGGETQVKVIQSTPADYPPPGYTSMTK